MHDFWLVMVGSLIGHTIEELVRLVRRKYGLWAGKVANSLFLFLNFQLGVQVLYFVMAVPWYIQLPVDLIICVAAVVTFHMCIGLSTYGIRGGSGAYTETDEGVV